MMRLSKVSDFPSGLERSGTRGNGILAVGVEVVVGGFGGAWLLCDGPGRGACPGRWAAYQGPCPFAVAAGHGASGRAQRARAASGEARAHTPFAFANSARKFQI